MRRVLFGGVLLGFAPTACKSEPPLSASKRIGPEGGEISLSDGLSLSVPPGALDEVVEIEVTRRDTTPAKGAFRSASRKYEFRPEGLTFAIPASLDIPYPDEGDAPEAMQIFVENGRIAGGVQTIGGGSISYSGGSDGSYVSGSVNHFSNYWCGRPAVETSFCYDPIKENLDCKHTETMGKIQYGITEWGGAGYEEDLEPPHDDCPLPNTSVVFSVYEKKLWILKSWDVKGENVSYTDAGFVDLLQGPVKALAPYVPSWDWRPTAKALPAPFTDPFVNWWEFAVWPEDEYQPMSYSFTLTLLDPMTGAETKISGTYDSGEYTTECMSCYRGSQGCDQGVADTGTGGGASGGIGGSGDTGSTGSAGTGGAAVDLTEGYWVWTNPDPSKEFFVDLNFYADGSLKAFQRNYDPTYDNGCNGVYNDGVLVGTWEQNGVDVSITFGGPPQPHTLEGAMLHDLDNPTRYYQQASESQTPIGCLDMNWP